MYRFDATKAERFFAKIEKRNPEFDYRTAFNALFELTSKLNQYEKAKKSNQFYSFFEFDSPSLIVGPHHRSELMLRNNILNIYTKILDKKDYNEAISIAKKQIGESVIDAMLFSKNFKHYEFALKYLIYTHYNNRLKDLKDDKKASSITYLMSLKATKAAVYSCNEIEKIITEKHKTQTF